MDEGYVQEEFTPDVPQGYDPMMFNQMYGGLYGYQPPRMDSQTFKQRNDPQELLFRFRLQLMNAYRVEEKQKDADGVEKTIFTIRFKKNTKPKANPQGVEDIISYLEKFVNNHTVQGNIETQDEYRLRMRFISNDIATHFMLKRRDWGIDINDVDVIVSNAINIVDMFFTRTLFNEERKSYGESYKENTIRQIGQQDKPNIFQRIGGLFTGRRGYGNRQQGW